jgi:hypothetical protein
MVVGVSGPTDISFFFFLLLPFEGAIHSQIRSPLLLNGKEI